MNDNKNMLERVLLMMKYDSSKTLTENSDVVKNEFSQILNEKGRFRAKAKPKLSAPKAPKVSPTKITASGLSVGDIKSQVATYAKTPLPNGKLPTPAQQVAYGKRPDGSTITCIIAGSCYEHNEDYMSSQGNKHWRGFLMLHDIKDGEFDLMSVSLDYIRKRYE